jgi:acetolactate synthase-1/3 small subunit
MCVLVDNEPGILSKVSGLLSARGFNIDSLTVTSTDVAEVSRMTVVLTGNETQMTQAKKQLEDLVNVWAVIDYTNLNSLSTETLLLKVSTVPPADLGMAAGTKVYGGGRLSRCRGPAGC